MTEAITASRADGLLRRFADAGVLGVADVQVARRLGELVGERDDRVLLAVALLVRGTRQGSVVLDLDEAADSIAPEETDELVELAWPPAPEWMSACASSDLIGGGPGGAPLRMVGSRLWLDRYWRQEEQVANDLVLRAADPPSDLDVPMLRSDLAALFPDDADGDQLAATERAARSRLSVIAGGPGTGKTTTIARLIAVLYRQQPTLRVALAAPTGKAAARLEEAVRSAGGTLGDGDRDRLAKLQAVTLHRLLGRRPDSASRFRHNRANRLPFDLVVVDECSMVSLTMMARLLEALAPSGRLVLVGDPDQLASVEAGAVLGDIVDAARGGSSALGSSLATLRTIRRFAAGGPIAQLAEHVRAGRADDALEVLREASDAITFHETADDEPISGAALEAVQEGVVAARRVLDAARDGEATAALDALDAHRLLCAHRSGPRGVRQWSETVEQWLAIGDPLVTARFDGRYAGQPLLVTANDYENGLYNGDTGVVLEQNDELVAAFRRGGAIAILPLVRLSDVQPMHAMTVHRAQGSQFRAVTFLLPPAASPLATRQTFYTAVTRATERVTIIGSVDALVTCVGRPAARASGLRTRLSGQ